MTDMASHEKTQSFVNGFWDDEILPTIQDYIRVPNVSAHFDPDWEAHGHVEKAVELVTGWVEKHKPEGSTLHIGRLPGRTPLLLLDVPGKTEQTVLMYGHLDKQPEMTGWRDGLGPWTPVMDGEKLYGRGGADDGYAVFASVCALQALRAQNQDHARVVVLIEFSEESGSPDLPPYVEHFEKLLGQPELVVCLDSGAGNYDQFWSTTSLRGLVGGTLKVQVLHEGVHSGDASGIVPSSFRLLRQLIDRLEDVGTGEIKPEALSVAIPEQRLEQARRVADVLKDEVYSKFPWVERMQPVGKDPTELILNRTWRPELEITGQDGIPALKDAGNVLRPYTTLNLSLRVPPTLPPDKAQRVVKELLEKNPPYGAKVSVDFHEPAQGWNAPELAPWLDRAIAEASETFYGKPALHMGEGGSIPFMGMLGEKFPKAQFVITGVLGPQSNAHGPNEFLHVGYAKKLTACAAHILEKHLEHSGR
jgi:acetylornithine deacetylase/succinyl-diaminopimelate desuccinylase-like protein